MNGVPHEIVDNMSESELFATFITVQELQSGKAFDWANQYWPD